MLPFNLSTSLDESEDEWIETGEEQHGTDLKQKNLPLGSAKKRRKNRPLIIPPGYFESFPILTGNNLRDMPISIDLVGAVEQNNFWTVYSDERVVLNSERAANCICVAPSSLPDSEYSYLTLLLNNPGCTQSISFPAVKYDKNKINQFQLVKDGIIGRTSDLFANGGLDLLKIQTRAKVRNGFPLSRDFESYVNVGRALFVFCLIPMENGEFVVSKACRSQPFFGASKRRQKTLGKRSRKTTITDSEINKFNTEIINIKTEIGKVNEDLQKLSYKRNVLKNCYNEIQRAINMKEKDKPPSMLCLALDLLTRSKNEVHISNAEEASLHLGDDLVLLDQNSDDDDMVNSLMSQLL